MPGKNCGLPRPPKMWETGALLVLFFFCVMLPSLAFAHRVYLFAWVDGDMIHTDSYFPNKKKVIDGTIRVYDPSGEKLLEGKTDGKGAFSFKIPKKADLRIVLEASMGHKTTFDLPMEEPGGGGESAPERDNSQSTKIVPDGSAPSKTDHVRDVVEEVIESHLQPIAARLARIEREKGPGITEIVGGIGYIIGLMGLVLYFKSRKEK